MDVKQFKDVTCFKSMLYLIKLNSVLMHYVGPNSFEIKTVCFELHLKVEANVIFLLFEFKSLGKPWTQSLSFANLFVTLFFIWITNTSA